jgi:hypothetical protein
MATAHAIHCNVIDEEEGGREEEGGGKAEKNATRVRMRSSSVQEGICPHTAARRAKTRDWPKQCWLPPSPPSLPPLASRGGGRKKVEGWRRRA